MQLYVDLTIIVHVIGETFIFDKTRGSFSVSSTRVANYARTFNEPIRL